MNIKRDDKNVKKFYNIKWIYRQRIRRRTEEEGKSWIKKEKLLKNNILTESTRAIFYYFIHIKNVAQLYHFPRKLFNRLCGNWRKLFFFSFHVLPFIGERNELFRHWIKLSQWQWNLNPNCKSVGRREKFILSPIFFPPFPPFKPDDFLSCYFLLPSELIASSKYELYYLTVTNMIEHQKLSSV